MDIYMMVRQCQISFFGNYSCLILHVTYGKNNLQKPNYQYPWRSIDSDGYGGGWVGNSYDDDNIGNDIGK